MQIPRFASDYQARSRCSLALLLFLLALLVPEFTAAAQESGEDQFVKWAAGPMQMLDSVEVADAAEAAALRRMIGSARIVALSEAVHEGAEPLAFRNRLLKLLVEDQGFTAIAIESGFTEGQGVHDYVLGGAGDLKTVVQQGFSWTFDRLPQNEALVHWLREYNADPRHKRKVNFYGYDMPGSPGNPEVQRGPAVALLAVLDYLEKVDTTAAAGLRARAEKLIPFLHLNPFASSENSPHAVSKRESQYSELTSEERDRLSALIEDVISLLQRRTAAYTAASSEQAYQWAYRNAVGAHEIDNFLRLVPLNLVPWKFDPSKPSLLPQWLWEAEELRDYAMADDLRWILQREGPDGKVLVYASRAHLAMSPVVDSASWETKEPHYPAGWYLKHEFPTQLVTIGNFIAEGSRGCGFHSDVKPPSPASFERVLLRFNAPLFVLDIRQAPPAVRGWLEQARDEDIGKVPVGRAFDIIFFIRRSTPACPQ